MAILRGPKAVDTSFAGRREEGVRALGAEPIRLGKATLEVPEIAQARR
jgi:hypothetical protein